MKTSLAHLPADKQADIARIVLLIRKFVAEAREKDAPSTKPRHRHAAALETASSSSLGSLEKIILFGSHARGDWVFDHYVEDGITYEYVSDYDILIITADDSPSGGGLNTPGALHNAHAIWDEVRDRFYRGRAPGTRRG